MAQGKTNIKLPLDKAIQRQQLVANLIKADAALVQVQKVATAIGSTVPPAPKTPAS